MCNYYEEKFNQLKNDFSDEEAFLKVVQVLLYQNTSSKIKEGNKFEIFWHSYFIEFLRSSILSHEDYVWAFAQYIRFNDIDEELYRKIISLNEETFINSVKLSGIISNLSDSKWEKISLFLNNITEQKIQDFNKLTNSLRGNYKQQKEYCDSLRKQLILTQLEAITFSSLYAWIFVVGESKEITIPYHISINDEYDNIYDQDVWMVLDRIIKTSYKNTKNKMSEKYIMEYYMENIIALYEGKADEKVYKRYESFCYYVANLICLHFWETGIMSSYNYNINNDTILKTDFFNEKRDVLSIFRLNKSFILMNDKKIVFNGGLGYRDINMESFYRTHAILFLLDDIYGVKELYINDDLVLNLHDTISTLVSISVFYRSHYVIPFLRILEQTLSYSGARRDIAAVNGLRHLMLSGLSKGKLRWALDFFEKKRKARDLFDWISEDISNNAKTKKMSEILDFWSYSFNNELGFKNQDVFLEKPFYKTDDFLFVLPHCLAWQDLDTTIINTIRKVYKNRKSLRKETSLIEDNLANIFKSHGMSVESSFMPTDPKVGEMDLVIIENDTVLLIELKSSYVRAGLDEINNYKYLTLKKASYQLDKKLDYLKKKYVDKKYFHSWIVDTTLEFDHNYFGSHLKISLEELYIILLTDVKFMERYVYMTESLSRGKEVDMARLEELKPLNNNLTLLELVNLVENNEFWKNNIELIRTLDIDKIKSWM